MVNGAWNTLSNNLFFSYSLILCQVLAAITTGVSIIQVAKSTESLPVMVPPTVEYSVVGKATPDLGDLGRRTQVCSPQ